MDNREKFRFEDFTLDNYKRLVQLALEMGYTFILHKDNFIESRKDVIWRHDVEFSPEIALKMAEIEVEMGVTASYFFQLHSDYYNTLSEYFANILYRIKQLGHNIGLHFDPHFFNIHSHEQLEHFINIDRKYFEAIFNIRLDTFSFHNTNTFILDCEQDRYGGLINVYSLFFKTKFKYCSDSTGYWRYEKLEDVLKDSNIKHLQVLTHDAMWSREVLSPRKRVIESIRRNAERVIDSYDFKLKQKGIMNIDD